LSPARPWDPDLDLGDGHSLVWTDWDPDLELNPQYLGLPPERPGEHHGAIIRHPAGPTPQTWSDAFLEGLCEGGIVFDTERNRATPAWDAQARWQVDSWDPLTISPSVLCACGDHGFIREGRWVRA
jgi:hypothetical protein